MLGQSPNGLGRLKDKVKSSSNIKCGYINLPPCNPTDETEAPLINITARGKGQNFLEKIPSGANDIYKPSNPKIIYMASLSLI